jgi:glycosyltransferase involved in cell wall biosynthesis
MTLRARNEADIIDAQLSFHLNAGVDFVVAIDNGSDDGTSEILESYARDGYVDVKHDAAEYDEGGWVTKMARRAATEFGADWVINSDADEFWWPRGGSLKDVLAAVPARYGSVRGMWRHFAPRPDSDDFFAERMTIRVCNPGAEDNSPYSPRYKTAHRADPDVEVLPGNHRALGRGLDPIRGWYPIDVLHFPIRSVRHFTEKYLRQWALLQTRFGEAVDRAHQSGRLRELYEAYVVDDVVLAEGIADGTLAVDTRLRDALRSLRAKEPHGPGAFALPPRAERLPFSDAAVDEGYLSEVATLEDGDPHAHAQRKAEDIETRLAAIEQRHSMRIVNLVSARVRLGNRSDPRDL